MRRDDISWPALLAFCLMVGALAGAVPAALYENWAALAFCGMLMLSGVGAAVLSLRDV